jgi:hypothetical protein
MKRSVIACCALSFMLATVGQGQTPISYPQIGDHYTRGQIKKMLRDAHTPDQYKALGDYYGEQQRNYLAQAADERREWIRRSQNTSAAAAKYPRPEDSSRNLYEYLMYKASAAGTLSDKYGQMAIDAEPTKPQ